MAGEVAVRGDPPIGVHEVGERAVAEALQPRRESEEHLRGRERVAQRLVRVVAGQAQLLRQRLERLVAGIGAVGDDAVQPPQHRGVDDAAGQPAARLPQRRAQEGALDPGRVGDRRSAPDRLGQRRQRLCQRRRRVEVVGQDAVDLDRPGVAARGRLDHALDRTGGADPAAVQRDGAECDHLVGLGVKAGQLHVHAQQRGIAPGTPPHSLVRPNSLARRRCTSATARKASFR